MISRHTIHFFLLLFSLSVLADDFCIPQHLERIDPHQEIFPLEREIADRLYLKLFGASEEKSLSRNWESKDNISWTFEVPKGHKFNSLGNWRRNSDINSEDVVYSIRRQLRRYAKTLFDEETFSDAKRFRLDQRISRVDALSANRVSIVFQFPTQKAEIEQIFGSGIGYIVPVDYDLKKENLVLFPTSTEYSVHDLKSSQLKLTSRAKVGKVEEINYKVFNPTLVNINDFKNASCDRLYYPNSELEKGLRANSSRFFPKELSKTKLFIIANPDLQIPEEAMKSLRAILGNKELKSLKGLEPFDGIFQQNKTLVKRLKFSTKPQTLDFYYCQSPTLNFIDYAELVQEITQLVKRELNISLNPVRRECSLVPSYINKPFVGFTLTALPYKSQDDLANWFNCSSRRSPAGFCAPENELMTPLNKKKETIEALFNSFPFVIPLGESVDKYLQF